MNTVRGLFPNTLPANVTNSFLDNTLPIYLKGISDKNWSLLTGHMFTGNYLAGDVSGPKIINEVIKSIEGLKTAEIAKQGVLTVRLDWGAQPDVDLHITEPKGAHVYYSNLQGVSGRLDVDDTTSYGPEHYFGSCDKLEEGVYRVGVNYYDGSAPETARIQITAGELSPRNFVIPLAGARGQGGDNSPIPVAAIRVFKDETGTFKFAISQGSSSQSTEHGCTQEISVIFEGSGTGRVVSEPAGIDCITGQPCEPKKFNDTVKLTAMTADGRGLEVGNHFTAWYPIDNCDNSCATSDTPNVCTLPAPKFKDYGGEKKQVKVKFTLERCFGGVGNRCAGAPTPAPVDEQGRTHLWVSVGSIWHDTCCLRHPLGYACQGLGTKTADENEFCRTEWDKAFPNLAGRGWTYIFGPYTDNTGDNLTGVFSNVRSYEELPATLKLKAPDGSDLDATDVAYCASGAFSRTFTEYSGGGGVVPQPVLLDDVGICGVSPPAPTTLSQ